MCSVYRLYPAASSTVGHIGYRVRAPPLPPPLILARRSLLHHIKGVRLLLQRGDQVVQPRLDAHTLGVVRLRASVNSIQLIVDVGGILVAAGFLLLATARGLRPFLLFLLLLQ